MDELTPDFEIPEIGKHLWDIYFGISQSVNRVQEGSYRLIAPTEYEAYLRLRGILVYPFEYDILTAMDRVYCAEANKELENIRSKENEDRQRQQEQGGWWGKKRRRG